MHFIGIDIGTSSVSGVIYDFTSKKIESVTLENDAAVKSSREWEKIQQPARIMELVYHILNDFSNRYADIKSIGVTGQMHGILYTDEQGNAVSPLYTWQDNRGNQPYRDNKTYVEFLSDASGYSLATGYGLVTHYYNMHNNLIPANARKVCTIMDYVVMKLTGNTIPVTDFSNAASLGFFNVESLEFDRNTLTKIGIDPSILPRPGNSASYCGDYKNNIAVYAAIGDNQAAFLGSVSDIGQSIHITVGTSSQISVYSDKYIKIDNLDTRPFPGGGYILVGAALCGGQAFALLKTFFEKTVKLFSECVPTDKDMYRLMTSVDYSGKTENLPVVTTLFNGTRHAPAEKGKIENISANNLTPENLIIGFANGIANELFEFYHKLPENIKSGKKFIIGSGNGMKRNPLLCKTFEKQFNCEVKLSLHEEEAAYGACINAMIAGGYIPDSFKIGSPYKN